jgi:hypothetical protein
MGFNKKYLPELPDLVKKRENCESDEEFIDFIDNYFRKADVLMGSPDSFKYISETRKKIEENGQEVGKRP